MKENILKKIRQNIENPLIIGGFLMVFSFILSLLIQVILNHSDLNSFSDVEPLIINAFTIGFAIFVLILTLRIYLNIYKTVNAKKTDLKSDAKKISPSMKYCLCIWLAISSIIFLYGGIYHKIYLTQEITPNIGNILELLAGSVIVGFQFFVYSLIIAFLIKRLT